MNNKYTYYLTLQKLEELRINTHRGQIKGDSMSETLLDWVSSLGGGTYTLDEVKLRYLNNLWKKYIWPRYYKCVALIAHSWEPLKIGGPSVITNWSFTDDFAEWAGHVMAWVQESTDRYAPLIKLYQDQEAHLLDKITTTTRNKSNDTPQTVSGGSVWDDQFVSATNETETTADAGSTIQKLDEVRKKWRSLYGQWADEFREFLMIGCDYEDGDEIQ